MKHRLYKTLKFIIKPFFYFVYNVKVDGLENIPKDDSVILCGNHKGNLDALLIVGTSPRVVHTMAKKELFDGKIKSFFFKKMCCIRVDRKNHEDTAREEGKEVLLNKEVLGIFPEGTVNKTKETILPFKYGAVSLATKTDSYIVPFSITGEYKLFKGTIRMTFGKAYKAKYDLEKENRILMNKVMKLIEIGDEKNNKKRKKYNKRGLSLV